MYPMNKALSNGTLNGDTFNHRQQAFASHAAKYDSNCIIPDGYIILLIQFLGTSCKKKCIWKNWDYFL